jgi:hypothetical protein
LFVSGGTQGELPEGMPPHMLVWRWFAATYGWPPDVVRALPLEAVAWFPVVEQAAARAEKIRADMNRPKGRGMR